MHAMFAAAPPEVRGAVADLLRSGARARRSRNVLDTWIAATLPNHPPPRARESSLSTRGRHHDLDRIAGEILERELKADFGAGRPPPRLTWGRTGGRAPRRGLRLGSYDAEMALVRIHPALDQEAVPDWFVRYVLFHELLHAVHPPVKNAAGRWVRHGRAFRERERAYSGLERAIAWEKGHIDALIRSARTRKPLRVERPAPGVLRGLVQRLLFPDELPASSDPVRLGRSEAPRRPDRKRPRDRLAAPGQRRAYRAAVSTSFAPVRQVPKTFPPIDSRRLLVCST
jgi:hypothetical protein